MSGTSGQKNHTMLAACHIKACLYSIQSQHNHCVLSMNTYAHSSCQLCYCGCCQCKVAHTKTACAVDTKAPLRMPAAWLAVAHSAIWVQGNCRETAPSLLDNWHVGCGIQQPCANAIGHGISEQSCASGFWDWIETCMITAWHRQMKQDGEYGNVLQLAA